MGVRDTYKLNLLDRTSKFSHSLNFWSKNADITLPGIGKLDEEPVSLSETSFAPLVLKELNGTIFNLEKDMRTFRVLAYDDRRGYNIIKSFLTDYLNNNSDKFCVDMALGLLSAYYVLCLSKREQTTETSHYTVFGIDALADSVIF